MELYQASQIDKPIDILKINLYICYRFLVDKEGKPIKRFAPNDDPVVMEPDIKAALYAASQNHKQWCTIVSGHFLLDNFFSLQLKAN